jgi:hypothetical protein
LASNMSEIFYKSKMNEFSVSDAENEAVIEGYGSVFGNVDLGLDVIEKVLLTSQFLINLVSFLFFVITNTILKIF